MSEMSAFAGLFAHLLLPFALFGLPLVLLGLVAAFFIWKDFEQAVDTTSAAERLAQSLEAHRQQAEEAAERHRLAIEHANEQHEQEAWQARTATLRELHRQMHVCAQAGMAADLHAACRATLDLDADDALAQRYMTSLSGRALNA